VGVTLGTGVGSAFAVDGDIVRSGDGVPPRGEIWNLPWDGGIVEDAISTRGIQSEYELRTKERPTVREIAERCPSDEDAVAVFEEFGETLGNVLKQVTAAFDPATIIFGGAISRSADLFLNATRRRLSESTTLKVSTLFEDAALLGAVVHWTHAELSTGKK
jgi:predicted NBD/HSP70 family sugar kinase